MRRHQADDLVVVAVLAPFTADGGRRLVRYAAVSAVSVATTQVLLVAGRAVVGLPPAWANALAVLAAAGPVYGLNRRWVWGLDGPSSWRKEVAPFWAFTVAGLALSTVAVAGMARLTHDTMALAVTNLAAFAVLWVAKFVALDGVVFSPAPAPVLIPVDRRRRR